MIFLSVIIPTRNRAKYLSAALESLTKQTYPVEQFEVLVVDNGSTDNTREVCFSFKNTIPNLRYFYEETPGLHVGRHLGMKMAKSEILAYADDDIEAFPTWLEGIAESFQDKEVVLVGGKNLPKFEAEPPDWILKMWEKNRDGNRILGFLSIMDLGEEIKTVNPCFLYGCNFSIRKTVLLEAGGFHPDAMPQELIRYRGDGESHVSRYILDKGYKATFHPKASIYHVVSSSRLTEEYFCRRAYNQGISDSYTQLRSQHIENAYKKLRSHKLVCYFQRLKEMTIIELYRVVIRHLRNKFLQNDSTSYTEIHKKLTRAYNAGYNYHQEMVKKDMKLFQYDLQEHYYNATFDSRYQFLTIEDHGELNENKIRN
jgi:glycosyltransferase involved in cell wall biosynthesis